MWPHGVIIGETAKLKSSLNQNSQLRFIPAPFWISLMFKMFSYVMTTSELYSPIIYNLFIRFCKYMLFFFSLCEITEVSFGLFSSILSDKIKDAKKCRKDSWVW